MSGGDHLRGFVSAPLPRLATPSCKQQHIMMDMANRPPGEVVMVVEDDASGHNEGTSLRVDAGYDEKY
jgi:hypothetical protein